jgi:hypothetical protein
MNKLAAFLLLAATTGTNSFAQVVYTFGTAGAYPNPGWTSISNVTPANRVLNYQNNLGTVSSNDLPAGNRYVNGQRTSYTSPDINTTCANASTVTIALIVDYDLENTYDWGYFQYSLNGGATWVNPVALSASNNNAGAAVNLSAYPPLIAWANNASNRNGWTNYGTVAANYVIPTSTTTRFRFIFASDGIVNSYTAGFTTYDYYFDVNSFTVSCNVVLPVELSSFSGYQKEDKNSLNWSTETERENDYFTVQWTSNPDSEIWNDIAYIKGKGNSETTTLYDFDHDKYDTGKINYYRIVQTDNNGTRQVYPDYVSIDNRKEKDKSLVKLVNLLGQEVDSNYTGVVIEVYDDGTTLKTYRNPY